MDKPLPPRGRMDKPKYRVCTKDDCSFWVQKRALGFWFDQKRQYHDRTGTSWAEIIVFDSIQAAQKWIDDDIVYCRQLKNPEPKMRVVREV